jgi:hypothetical protein
LKNYLLQNESNLIDKILIISDTGLNQCLLENNRMSPDFEFLYDQENDLQKGHGIVGNYKNNLPVVIIEGIGNQQAILLNKNKIGSIIQYCPDNPSEEIPFWETDGNIIYYRLDFYSENQELYREESLQNGEYHEELLTQAKLRIGTKATFQPADDFDGILFNLEYSQVNRM